MFVVRKKFLFDSCAWYIIFWHSTYRSRATDIRWVCLCLLNEWLDFISCVITSIIMRSNDGLDDLAVIVHFCHYLWFLSLLTRWLHCSQNFGLFAFRNAAKPYSWKENKIIRKCENTLEWFLLLSNIMIVPVIDDLYTICTFTFIILSFRISW